MMKYILLNLIFILTLFLQSCIEAPKNARKSISSATTTTTSTSSPNAPTFTSDQLLYWYSSSAIQGTIALNKTSTNTYYLRGQYVHNFLITQDTSNVYNYNKQYCLVGNFANTALYKQIRLRAIPVSTTNSNKITERMLRIDVSSTTDNQSQCNVSTIDSILNTNSSFSLTTVCSTPTNCAGKVTTTNLALYTVQKTGSTITSLSKVDASKFNSTSINMQIDMNSNSTTDTSVCSNSACGAKGFDCCIEGQCVKDGTFKTNATLDSQYSQAYAEYTTNPLSFINWPNIFNVCANIAHSSVNSSTSGTSSTTEAQSLATAQDRINAYLKQWYCLDDVSKSVDSPNYARCIGKTVSGSQTAYDEVRYSVAQSCGCTVTADLLDIKCPNWTIKPIYNSSVATNSIATTFIGYFDATVGVGGLITNAKRGQYYIISKGGTLNSTSYSVGDWIIYDGADWFKFQSNISDFFCYTPAVENQIGSITNLNVSVSARSAAHRFFANNGGTNYDDIAKLPATIVQENKSGDEDFSYLDEANKSGPNSGSYNYKSILGTMLVDLSKTAPAKMVTVELGKTYILTSISGYFTPCPQCARDSWFQSFFAHPTSQRGIGLQASGYSTTRDAYGNNDTLGNYEDTHFGRACYLPLTMIPIAHQKNSDLQTQRLNRLKTQSAFYINGYQKDWFGFNQGALIGSFDGVTWFGVGTGRRVTATSTKLFLAFNAPFLDLATKTDTVVNIIPDLGTNSAANVDYDPSLSLKDPLQGSAATCQSFHQCNTDSECISQLGWEYVCADVSQFRSTWPIFDSNANELKNQEKVATIFDILSNTISTNTTRRCVYRGSGAPCKKDISYFNTTGNTTYKKMLTCAPNFYCASINTNKFNSELVRTPNEFDNILFGMDANVLGRPLNYVTANKSLHADIISNIQYNGSQALSLGTAASDLGMCQPGKLLLTSISASPENDYVKSHSNPDALKRTDYISQIGSCNSNTSGAARTYNCPIFGNDGNYVDPSTDPTVLAAEQNSCSGEVRQASTFYSAFKSIETGTLASTSAIATPSLAADACLRKAGSICHTDLDCGPNTMHESIVGGLNINYFGGTDAEKSYWSESLICGQSTPQPLKNATNYFSYKLSENRCCREIGKDFSMYTKGDKTFIPDQPTNSVNLDTRKFSYTDPSGANRYSRYTVSKLAHDPFSSNIYGASDMVPQVPSSSLPAASIHEPNQDQWQVINETGSLTCCGGGWVRKFADGTHTWPIKSKLSFDTTNFSCLNFRSALADSNFPNTNANLMVSLPTGTPGSAANFVVSQAYLNEYDQFCKYPQDGGCLQIPFKDSNTYGVKTPERYYPGKAVDYTESDKITVGSLDDLYSINTSYSRIDTSPTADPTSGQNWGYRLNSDAPYPPIAYYNYKQLGTYKGKAYNFFFSKDFGYSTHFYLPPYVGFGGKLNSGNLIFAADPGGPNPQIANSESFIRKVYIKYYYDQANGEVPPKVEDITQKVATEAECQDAINYSLGVGFPADALNENEPGAPSVAKLQAKWCLSYNSKTSNRPVMIVRANNDVNDATYKNWVYAGVVIDFIPIEQKLNIDTAIPGNPLYYLEKLGRFELLGIPQITYEPLYCNSNQKKLVQGLFKSTYKTRSDFTSNSYTYSSFDPIEAYNADDSANESDSSAGFGNVEKKFVYQDKVDHPAIFSSKDFTCCTPLGKEPKNGTGSCCSGYAVTKNNKSICSLPTGTDLNVYFNKFVSSEGVGNDQPGGGLVATFITDVDGDGNMDYTDEQATENIDFNPFTGEPKLRDSTYQKLFSLGVSYCSTGKVGVGASFGSFPPEPFGGSYGSFQSTSSGNYTYPTSIVDSIIDINSDGSAGKIMFDQGFRWNHHYYCK